MIRLTLIFLLGISIGANANDISKINKLKKDAELAYKAGQYDEAIKHYSYLIDTLQIEDEQATLNFGHAYYQLGNKDLAQSQYQKLVLSEDQNLKSIAYQQLGALSNDPKTLEKALSYFKESIKSDPSNEDARYNYELVKKKLKEQKEQNQDQQQNQDDQENQENKDDQQNKDEQNQDQQDQQNQDKQDSQEQNEDQQNQDQQDQEGQEGQENDEQNKEQQEGQENKEQEGDENQQQPKPEEGEEGDKKENEQQPMSSPSEKLKEINISEEKAKMILEALKNSEIQYIQQNRRKPTKRKESDKPDW